VKKSLVKSLVQFHFNLERSSFKSPFHLNDDVSPNFTIYIITKNCSRTPFHGFGVFFSLKLYIYNFVRTKFSGNRILMFQ
jgi:hypothetical protein